MSDRDLLAQALAGVRGLFDTADQKAAEANQAYQAGWGDLGREMQTYQNREGMPYGPSPLREELQYKLQADPITKMMVLALGTGNIGGKASALSKLPMDEASRMAREKEMGFDGTWYHGTDADISAFRGRDTYMARNPDEAARYADVKARYSDQGAVVYPLAIRGKMIGPKEIAKLEQELGGGNYVPSKDVYAEAARRGYSGFQDEDIAVVFDPKNIRSKFANFDPAKKDSSDLLASMAAALAGGGAAVGMTQEGPY